METKVDIKANSVISTGMTITSAEAKEDRTILEMLLEQPGGLVADYDPEYCETWWKIENQRKKLMEGQFQNQIITFGSRPSDMDRIFKIMECSRCTQICLRGSRSCGKGHLICSDCLGKMKGWQCPLQINMKDEKNKSKTNKKKKYCKCRIIDDPLPIFEKFLEAVAGCLKCEFGGYGCPKMMAPLKRRSHEAKCFFRPIFSCSFDNCNVIELSGPQLIDHLVQFHNVPYIEASHFGAKFPFGIPLNAIYWTCTFGIVSSHQVHFLLNMGICDKKIYLWASTLEEEFPANVNKFHLKLTPKDKENMITVGSWSIESRPFNVSRTYIIDKDWMARAEEDFAKFVEDYVTKTAVPPVGGSDDGFLISLKMDVQIQTGDEMRQAYVNKGYDHRYLRLHGSNS